MPPQPPEVPGGPHLRTVAMPGDANPGGVMFGGWTLGQMDLAGATFAAERAHGRVATVGIEAMKFLRPIPIGDEVSCYCRLEHLGRTSITVHIETWTRGRGGEPAEKVTDGVFTFVALGDDNHPREIQGGEDRD